MRQPENDTIPRR